MTRSIARSLRQLGFVSVPQHIVWIPDIEKHFSIGSSRASLTRICAVPEVEIWRRVLFISWVLPGDKCFWREMLNFTQSFVGIEITNFSICSSSARLAGTCVVPEVEIWRRIYWERQLLAGDKCCWSWYSLFSHHLLFAMDRFVECRMSNGEYSYKLTWRTSVTTGLQLPQVIINFMTQRISLKLTCHFCHLN